MLICDGCQNTRPPPTAKNEALGGGGEGEGLLLVMLKQSRANYIVCMCSYVVGAKTPGHHLQDRMKHGGGGGMKHRGGGGERLLLVMLKQRKANSIVCMCSYEVGARTSGHRLQQNKH